MMRAALSAGVAVAALALAACSTPAPPPEPDRKTERAPDTLPDAYKHPPK